MSARNRRRAILVGTLLVDAAIVAALAPDFNLAANVLIVLLAVKCIVFVVLYGIRSNWTATAPGRAVMGLVGSLALISVVGSLTITLGDYPGRPVVRLVMIWLAAVAVMPLLLSLIDAQRNGGGDT